MAVAVRLQDAVGRVPGGVERWLYAGEDAAWRLRLASGPLAGLAEAGLGEARAAAAARLRDPYLAAIAELSRRNDSPEWWSSHLAAKHLYPSLFARLCALAAAGDELADGTLAVCATPALAGEVAALARSRGLEVDASGGRPSARGRAAGLAERAGWPLLRAFGDHAPAAVRARGAALADPVRFAIDRTPGHRRRTLAAAGAGRGPAGGLAGENTALLVTWLDGRSFAADGSYHDPHLGPLAERLRERGLRTAILGRVFPGVDFAQTAAALAASGEPAFLPDAWLSAPDWRACERAATAWRPDIPGDLAVDGVPLASLAREYVDEHRRALADALTYATLVERLAAAGVRPGRVILPWEGHAWELSLTRAVHAHWPGTPVVGYDNLNFTRLALSLYAGPGELELRPLPDRVVTNGPTFARVLEGEGFPAERIRVGCALRHRELSEAEPPPPREPADPLRVLVAGTIDAAQTAELAAVAERAFSGDASVTVTLKEHPAADPIASSLSRSSAPIGELLLESDAMLYAYTSVVWDALHAAVPPVFVRSPTFLDLDQLDPFPGLGWRAAAPGELRAAAAEIRALRGNARAAWAERARAAVAESLAPCTDAVADAFL